MDPKSGFTHYMGVVQPIWLAKPAHMFKAKGDGCLLDDHEFYFDEDSKELVAFARPGPYVIVSKVFYLRERTFTDNDFKMEQCPQYPPKPLEKDATDATDSIVYELVNNLVRD